MTEILVMPLYMWYNEGKLFASQDYSMPPKGNSMKKTAFICLFATCLAMLSGCSTSVQGTQNEDSKLLLISSNSGRLTSWRERPVGCKLPDRRNHFIGKQSETLTVTKSGNAGDDEIDAISGASYTSAAVTNAVNAALYFVQNFAESLNLKRG